MGRNVELDEASRSVKIFENEDQDFNISSEHDKEPMKRLKS